MTTRASGTIAVGPAAWGVESTRRAATTTLALAYGRSATLLSSTQIPVHDPATGPTLQRVDTLQPGDLVVVARWLPAPSAPVTELDVLTTLRQAGYGTTLRVRGEQVLEYHLERLTRSQPARFAPRVAADAHVWATLTAARKAAGLTGAAMATHCGLAQAASISEYETGRRNPTEAVFTAYLTMLDLAWPDGARIVDGTFGGTNAPRASYNARFRNAATDAWLRDLDDDALAGLDAALVYPSRHRELTLPTRLPVDPDLGLVLGWLVAEGSLHRGRVRFSLGPSDAPYLAELGAAVERLTGRTPTVRQDLHRDTAWELYFDHLPFAELLRALGCVGTARYKRVPSAILNADAATQRAFLRGLYLGDGCKGASSCGSLRIVTTSLELTHGVMTLLAQQGIFAALHRVVEAEHRAPGGRVYPDYVWYQLHVAGGEQLRQLESLWRGTPTACERSAALEAMRPKLRDAIELDDDHVALPVRSVTTTPTAPVTLHRVPAGLELLAVGGIPLAGPKYWSR